MPAEQPRALCRCCWALMQLEQGKADLDDGHKQWESSQTPLFGTQCGTLSEIEEHTSLGF